jgi:hypothetical protein
MMMIFSILERVAEQAETRNHHVLMDRFVCCACFHTYVQHHEESAESPIPTPRPWSILNISDLQVKQQIQSFFSGRNLLV